MKHTLLASSLLLLLAAAGLAQPQPAPAAQPPAVISSPEVHADNSVTFRFLNPNAHEVMLALEGAKPAPMQKDDQGIWSLTTAPLAPDFYGYSFVADGVGLIDPSNPLMKPNLLHTQSQVHVPGPASLPWEISDVPHGLVHHHFYKSAWWVMSGTFTFTRRLATIQRRSGAIPCSICSTGSAMTPVGGRRWGGRMSSSII